MEHSDSSFDRQTGERLKALRQGRGLTLDALATRADVSRAMISRIERGEASPTAQLLARLCHALGTTLSRFFATTDSPASPLRRHCDQHVWRDPDSGYLRRSVSPENNGSPVDVVEVIFPAGARVAFEPQPGGLDLTQNLWLLEGSMMLTLGHTTHVLQPGDCLFMHLGQPITFFNPQAEPARYAIILDRSKA